MFLEFKLLLIAWFVTHFEPVQELLQKLYLINRIEKLVDVITCFKCLSFWLVLIGTWDVFLAIVASLIAHLYDSITEGN